MKSKSMVTIGGKTRTLDAYLAEQDELEKMEKGKDYLTTTPYVSLYSKRRKGEFKIVSGVVSTRMWTPEEIAYEDARVKGAEKMRNGKDLSSNSRFQTMLEIMRTQGRWYTPNEIYVKLKDIPQRTRSANHSKVSGFFMENGMMYRRRQGKIFNYRFTAEIKDPGDFLAIAREWWDKFLDWENKKVKDRQKKKGVKKGNTPETPFTPIDIDESPKKLGERIAGALEEGFKNAGLNVKVEVEGEIRILFGFIR